MLRALARGLSDSEIARVLGIGRSTVKTHVHAILDRPRPARPGPGDRPRVRDRAGWRRTDPPPRPAPPAIAARRNSIPELTWRTRVFACPTSSPSASATAPSPTSTPAATACRCSRCTGPSAAERSSPGWPPTSRTRPASSRPTSAVTG
ncbi:helix-turn-helix domain-containing protein [Streptomyces sp. B6B3]|uniref:response regulator transcription factor n=1 Tax=Streptomyces sp. B6B3 TaxID=3153570 RepID=UPI00325F8954